LSIAERIENLVPYLRRYARASTGNTIAGDACVEQVLKRVLSLSLDHEADPEQFNREGLYRLLEQELQRVAETDKAQARRALLLVAVEGFSHAMACRVLGVRAAELEERLVAAEQDFAATTATCMLIIEDEPLISAHLRRLAEGLGHTVTGIATRRTEAVALSQAQQPDIVLCDIQLADGSLGTDAIADMNLPDNVPVVYVTAYPEKYLSTTNEGPSYLITKPFDPEYLKAVIGHALINVQEA
jgi:CheY-like chemotaxis protein